MSEENPTLRIVDIVAGTSVDGPGLRTAVYFAGCDHRCPGCHNPHTWPHDAGCDMKTSELLDIIETEDFNVTLTGGDPIYQAKRLYPLIEGIKRLGKSVWIYTGFKYEELLEMNDVRSWLPMVEAVVDGPYIEALRDISLPFRGSSNQRIIYIKED